MLNLFIQETTVDDIFQVCLCCQRGNMCVAAGLLHTKPHACNCRKRVQYTGIHICTSKYITDKTLIYIVPWSMYESVYVYIIFDYEHACLTCDIWACIYKLYMNLVVHISSQRNMCLCSYLYIDIQVVRYTAVIYMFILHIMCVYMSTCAFVCITCCPILRAHIYGAERQ